MKVPFGRELPPRYENLIKLAMNTAVCGVQLTGARCPIGDAQPADTGQLVEQASRGCRRRHDLRHQEADADNVLKGIKDGCNGIVWADDARVVRIMFEKRYSETPCAVVHVVEVAGEAA